MLNAALLGVCVAVAIVAYTAIGPASQSGGQGTRTSIVKRGVVQATVSGSGNIQSASQLNLGFKTSGTVTHIYVKQGQQVAQGQLLATLDSKSAEVTLEQAKATLKSSEASLAQLEEHEGESSSGQGSSGTGSSGTGATATAAATNTATYASYAVAASSANALRQSDTATTPASGTGAPTTSTGTSTTPTTTPATTTPAKQKTTTHSSSPSSGSTSRGSTSAAKTTESSSPSQSSGSGQAASASSTKQSAATREANLASARAAVKSDKLTVQNDEQAVQNTKLYAPEDGTIVSLSGEVGETVSGSGTTKAPSSTSSSNGSSSSSAGGNKGTPTGGASGGGSSTTSSSSSNSSSSSSFAVLSNLESLQLVVALSESEIGSVHEGQIATVTVEALSGRKLAAHVVSVSQVPASSSGAVSYDVTFKLDQGAEGLKVGMSATAEVVVKEAEGINVPTSAIKGGAVTVLRGGKHVVQPVPTGLAGDSSTIILSGLNVGEEVVLPTTSTTSGASLSSRLGSRGGSRGGLGGALGGSGFPSGGFAGGGPPGG